jgi:hypothetical protein
VEVEYQRPVLIYDRIDANRRKTFLLLIGFFVLVAAASTAIGYLMGLPPGLSPVIILFVLLFAAFSYSSACLGCNHARPAGEAGPA